MPKRANTFSALRRRVVGTRARKSVALDIAQKCSESLISQERRQLSTADPFGP
jgi:hypothetical protein